MRSAAFLRPLPWLCCVSCASVPATSPCFSIHFICDFNCVKTGATKHRSASMGGRFLYWRCRHERASRTNWSPAF